MSLVKGHWLRTSIVGSAVILVVMVGAEVAMTSGGASVSNPVSASTVAPSPTTQDVSGTLTLVGEGSYGSCTGTGGYDDVEPGMAVTLLDSSNRTIGVSSLGSGTSSSGDCVFKFDFGPVPVTSDFYAVDSSRRGKTTYSKAELQGNNWKLDLSIGH